MNVKIWTQLVNEPMNLKQWCDIEERIHIAEEDERCKQYAGLYYNKKLIEKLAKLKQMNAKVFLDLFLEPAELFLASINNIADSTTKSLELKLFSLRNNKIVSSKHKFNGQPVNWSTWRQFNSTEKDPRNRMQVFDEFIEKTSLLSTIIKARFNKISEIYNNYGWKGKKSENANKRQVRTEYPTVNENISQVIQLPVLMNPLDGYLADEKISYSQLIKFVKSIGQEARMPFREALAKISRKMLSREAEYYDDFYFFRNKIYSDIEGSFSRVSATDEVMRTLKIMQFDLSKIQIDIVNRQNKYPSPICFFVQIPTDVRVLYKSESPYFDMQGCFHEMGHAIHGTSIDHGLEYWDRYLFPMGTAEIFSILLERLTKNKRYLKGIGIKDERVLADLKSRNNFMDLFFVTFYTANSLMKAEFWRRNLSMRDASTLYSKLISEYTGFDDFPGEYWMLHHILPDAIMYVPSYLFAAVRAAELDRHLQNKFGEMWWNEQEAGKYLREIMCPGRNIDLHRFSNLERRIFVKEITGDG